MKIRPAAIAALTLTALLALAGCAGTTGSDNGMEGMDHGGMDMPAATPTPVDHSQHGAPPVSPEPPTEDEKETEEDTPTPPDHSAHGDTP